MLLRKHLQSLKKSKKISWNDYNRIFEKAGFGYGGLFQAPRCFSRFSLHMPTHKCSQCLNTGISRAESDLGSLHFFIWEISVPLTEWNCLRIKLWIYENHIWDLRGEELYERRSSQLYRRNFCSWEKKAFCSCVHNCDDLSSFI